MKRIYLVSYLLVAVFALSCKAVDYSETPPVPDSQFVTADDQLLIDRGLKVLQLSDAERVAQRFMLKDTKKMFSVGAATRADHLTAVRDSAGNPVMYVVNFEQGGFCIVSATKKAYPILAHSDEGFFDLEKVGQSGVCIWLDEMVYGITHRDTLSEEERIFVNSAWAEYEKGFDLTQTRAFGDINDPRFKAFIDRLDSHYDAAARDGQPLYYMKDNLPAEVYSQFSGNARSVNCPEEYAIVETINNDYYKSVGPLLTTKWGQDGPFNSAIPKIGDVTPPAGCMSIAMTQVMNFFKWPTMYYWNLITNNDTSYIANFIYDVGQVIETSYGLTGSGAYNHVVEREFRDYGYRVSTTNGNPDIDWLISGFPIFATGTRAGGVGHAWVIDGASKAEERKIYKLDCQYYKNGEYVYQDNTPYMYYYNSNRGSQKTHVNWGHAGDYNAWYVNVNQTYMKPDRDYCLDRKNIYVKPIK